LRPAAVTVDQHAPLLEGVGHQRGRLLCVLQAHDLNVTGKPAFQASGQRRHPGGRGVGQGDEKVDVGALGRLAGCLRAEEHGEPDVRLGAQRVAQRAQQRPVPAQVGLFGQRGLVAPRARAPAVHETFGGGAAQGALRHVEMAGESTQGVRRHRRAG